MTFYARIVAVLTIAIVIAINHTATAAPTPLSREEIRQFLLDQDQLVRKAKAPSAASSTFVSANNSCSECRETVTILSYLIVKNPLSDLLIEEIVKYVCDKYKLSDKKVCSMIAPEFKGEVLFVVQQLFINPDQICPMVLEECGSPDYKNVYNWTQLVKFPNTTKPPVEPYDHPPTGSPTLRILQISDLHIDFQYAPGSEANCLDPLCCRTDDTRKGVNISVPAGYWGSYHNCDSPYWTVESIFDFIAKNEKFDMVYWTGDLPAHNIWKQSRYDQLFHYSNITTLFKRYFGKKPVYSAVGNHESAPVDSYPAKQNIPDLPANLNSDWIYSALEESWINWVEGSAVEDILKRASYSSKVTDKLRVISLNTNYFDGDNFWMYLNQTDPDGVMQWFVDELQKAEDNKEKVHIIGHEPPGGSGGKYWSWYKIYYDAINRYESTIRGQFFGHTHSDDWGVFFDQGDPANRVTGTHITTHSITTYNAHHPGYKIYTIDARPDGTWAALDYEAKLVNVSRANLEKWETLHAEHEYNFTTAYQTKDLFPDSFRDLLNRMNSKGGGHLVQNYKKFNNWSMGYTCDSSCLKGTLCGLQNCYPKVKHCPCQNTNMTLS